MAVEGLDNVLKNLNKEIKGIEKRSLAGLKAAGLKVQREAQKRVPVDTGNLKGSAFTETISKEPPVVVVGFSALYALAMHENKEQKLKGEPRADFGKTKEGVGFGGGTGKGKYWEVGEPKFLENAVRELRTEIVDTIRAFAKVK